jgi:hypothetical protein
LSFFFSPKYVYFFFGCIGFELRPEFTDWESKVDARSSPELSHGTKMSGKHHTLHTKEAHERYLMSKV